LAEAGIVRVVYGTRDPNAKAAGGDAALRARGIQAVDGDLPEARRAIEAFATAVALDRPYLALKMAAALNGTIGARGGEKRWLSGDEARALVRDLRIEHDAVMVGAGTVRTDDPQLSVRPPHRRRVPYRRVVVCEEAPIPTDRRVLAREPGAETVILAPCSGAAAFRDLESLATVVHAPDHDGRLDLHAALRELKTMGIHSVLCEGGPTLAAGLLARGLVDRLHWLIVPALIAGPQAPPSIAGTQTFERAGWRFDEVRRVGEDVYLSGRIA
ncbi:MAG: bifunctional diaminohydroxyphosphoribosylaminopyrimidine deaminase/5-amino-6-(5-phosphoribosylamino)uracil reductase, partial [bacterium]|nr:bifunctional diaminohydroxyphosphoribosylaminopyrimidine deaminase/5-amino-6-(5-phosphoribosylamino)uracil reductase [bacterium]